MYCHVQCILMYMCSQKVLFKIFADAGNFEYIVDKLL